MDFGIRRWFCALLCVLLLGSLAPAVQAEETEAKDISGREIITDHQGIDSLSALFDGKTKASTKVSKDASLTASHEGGIGSVYLMLNKACKSYTVTNEDSGETVTLGQEQFIHQLLDLEAAFGTAPKTVTIRFDSDCKLNEVYFFTPGQVPDFVQKWELPQEGKIDLMLFPTHSDDDQLFFAGILPYYGVEMDYEILVVYLTGHQNREPWRQHELLDGLYAVGTRTYPIIGSFGDFYVKSRSAAYQRHANWGESADEMLGYVVEQLRRFKPLVAVGHDLRNGEYGHGQHMMYADLLCKALDVVNDPEKYPETAEQYGTWEVPKTYLHVWPENKIVLDWDTPLESFGGMTAYEVSKDLGFTKHESQRANFNWYFAYSKTAAGLPYSPCNYGLYRSTVGEDVEKNDFFENLVTYGEQARLAEEARLEAERLEAERLAAEEEARRQEEARKAEEERKAEAERLAAEAEAQRLAEEEAARIAAEQRKQRITYAAVAGGALIIIGALALLIWKRKK